MASNRLVANPTKATLLLINNKEEGAVQFTVGNATVSQEKTSKPLGVKIDDNMNWNEHVYGKGGLISSLTQRTHMIKRLRNHIGGKNRDK